MTTNEARDIVLALAMAADLPDGSIPLPPDAYGRARAVRALFEAAHALELLDAGVGGNGTCDGGCREAAFEAGRLWERSKKRN